MDADGDELSNDIPWNTEDASAYIDTVPPVAAIVSAIVKPGQSIHEAYSSEPGRIYLLPEGTYTNEKELLAVDPAEQSRAAVRKAYTNTEILAPEMEGVYRLYAVDPVGNVSAASQNTVVVPGPKQTGKRFVDHLVGSMIPTRVQAVTLLLNMLGVGKQVQTFVETENFIDVQDAEWARGVMAFIKAYPELGIDGVDPDRFDPNAPMSSQVYSKILLEMLGYQMNIDFQWEETFRFAASLGLHLPDDPDSFTWNDLSAMTRQALHIKLDRADSPWIQILADMKKQ